MSGVKFINLKQIIEFMYHGEVKIMEEELESLLVLAEMFKVKGLSNVRNKHVVTVDNNNEQNKIKKRKLSTENSVKVSRSSRKCICVNGRFFFILERTTRNFARC